MDILSSIFKLSAGIGLFLFGMFLLEESIKDLSGRNFKIFLQRVTKNRFGAVSGGVIITGILQSSSLVSLMVLAFVGAGVFTIKNALAIILGANLGTTITSWLLVILGFKVNIEIAAYPAVCLGGLLLIFFNNKKIIKSISFFLFGFGLLFIAISFIKLAMELHVKDFNFSNYSEMPLLVFLLVGFVITVIVQSSSITMALTLSALNISVIDFSSAAAIILGSEIGTTIKVLLGAVGGSASKKRVAFGNFLFNIVVTVFIISFLKPIVFFITDILGINDVLIGLVTFSSFINLLAIIIFIPFLDFFEKLLERVFKETNSSAVFYIKNASVNEAETALDLFKKETAYFINNCMLFNFLLFDIKITNFNQHPEFLKINDKRKYVSKSPEEKYIFLKQQQGEMQAFYISFRSKLQGVQFSLLSQLNSSVRSAMYSVKSVKDVGVNLDNLRRSSKDIKFNFFLQHKKETEDLYTQLNKLMEQDHKDNFESLRNIFNLIERNYSSALNDFYKTAQEVSIDNTDITTVLNFNRELFTSNKAILMAVKDFLLTEKEAQDFNEIPVYKT